MLRVGLTGGLASGKSSVARIFRELGAHVLDADQVARDVVVPGSPALETIARAFGREVLLPDGSLDRQALGRVVFADPAKRRTLEGILHPPILAEIDRRVSEIERTDPQGIAVVEAALILELDRKAEYDAIVVVWTPEGEQVDRAAARDGLGAAEAHRRLDAQMPLDQKRPLADFVVNNTGTPEECRADAVRVYRKLEQLAAARGG